jgi:uncharacterized cupredoxin-like copper-binding protein
VRRLLPAAAAVALAVAGCGAGEPGMGFRTIEITVEHSEFDPQEIGVRPGETVRFVILNGDPIDHEFILGDEAVQQRHEDGTEPEHGAKPGEVSIPAGSEAETTFTFDENGGLIFGCHLPGHYAYGMRGLVRIG